MACSLYVTDDGRVNDEQFKEVFADLGNISSCDVINLIDKSGRPRRIAVVSYESPVSANSVEEKRKARSEISITLLQGQQSRITCVDDLLQATELSPGKTGPKLIDADKNTVCTHYHSQHSIWQLMFNL